MKLLIVRHGDPDYERDSLTEKGWKEAELLAERLGALDVRDYYVSPLGRAKATASLTLERAGREATECPWLREFKVDIRRPDVKGKKTYAWDWLPQDWTKHPEFFQPGEWHRQEAFAAARVKEEYDRVTAGLDALLARHGYVREGALYRAVRGNNDTIVLFCHFGVQCVLLSHLLNASPMVLWQGFCAAPSSVTTVATEERRRGVASFRVLSFGDVSHLYAAGEPPAFAGRFCESFGNPGERVD